MIPRATKILAPPLGINKEKQYFFAMEVCFHMVLRITIWFRDPFPSCHMQTLQKITLKSIHKFLSNPACQQTSEQDSAAVIHFQWMNASACTATCGLGETAGCLNKAFHRCNQVQPPFPATCSNRAAADWGRTPCHKPLAWRHGSGTTAVSHSAWCPHKCFGCI